MKEVYIANIRTAQEVTDFFMVKSIAVKIGANKKQYLDLMLGDKTGEISGKKWDVSDEELPSLSKIKEGDIIKIDIPSLKIELDVPDEVLAKRKANWQPRKPRITTGYLARYAAMVTSGNRGAVLEVPKSSQQ